MLQKGIFGMRRFFRSQKIGGSISRLLLLLLLLLPPPPLLYATDTHLATSKSDFVRRRVLDSRPHP
jgi:hypothetical protein